MNIPGYSIEQEIGHGGMATVYLVLQESLQRHVALKVLSPVLATDKNFSKRFLREGRLVARLADPRIVKVFDIGFHDYIPYISMEYLAGGTLKERIEKRLPLQETLDIIKTVAGALGYAHQRGIIHRDIKPQNILFTESGSPVLSDFGIAKALGSTTTIMTASGVSLGTPRYMSPEQIKGQQIDSRADIYSLGVLFYEMLTGELPYFAEDSFAMAFMHVAEPIPELPLNLAVFQPVLNKLLAKKAIDRFETAEQFIDAIKQIERTGAAGVIPDKTGSPKISKKTKQTPRRSALPVLATTVVSLLVAAALYLVMNPPPWFFGPDEQITALDSPQKPDTEEIKPSTTLEQSQPPLAEEKQQQARQFLVQAIQYQQKGLLEDSLQQIAQGLQAMPEHHRLLALQEEVKSRLTAIQHQEAERLAEAQRQQEQQQRRQKAEQLLTQAKQDLTHGNLEGSVSNIEQGLRLVPEYAPLLALRQEVMIRLQSRMTLETPAKLDVNPLLNECATHFKANRLTTGQGGNAVDCYREVLAQDPGNAEAQAGLEQVVEKYASWAETALDRQELKKVRTYLERLKKVSPDHAKVAQLQQRLTAAEEAAKAENMAATMAQNDTEEIKPTPEPAPEKTPIEQPYQPQPAQANLAIHSNIQSTKVWINGNYQGTAPLNVALAPGNYQVRVEKTGYMDWMGTINLSSGDSRSLMASLERMTESKPLPRTAAYGCIEGNCTDGTGTYQYESGNQYSGHWKDGQINGRGTYYYLDRGEKYVGQWRNGIMHGRGAYFFSNGEKYVGEYREGVMQGEGIYYYASGNRYEGEWKNGKRHGKGAFYFSYKGEKYVGEYRNDQPNGQGTYYYSNGDRYSGQWKNGRMHGEGIYYYSNGEQYAGIWEDGKKIKVTILD